MQRRHLLLALKAAISLGLLVWLFARVDLNSVLDRLATIDSRWLVAALFLLAIGYILCGLRWAWMAQGLGLKVSRNRKIRLYFLGMFASLFLPSTIGGDVVRGILLAKGEGRSGIGGRAAASVVLDRVNGLFALTLMVTLCMLPFSWPPLWWLAWLALTLGMWGSLVVYPLLHRQLIPRLPFGLSRLAELPLLTAEFRRAWWKSMPVSLLFQAIIVQAHWCLGMAVGLDLDWTAYAVMVGMVGLLAILPISLNGFGVREAGYVGFAALFGGSPEAAAAMAALWVIVLVLASLPGGYVLWQLGGRKELEAEPEVARDGA